MNRAPSRLAHNKGKVRIGNSYMVSHYRYQTLLVLMSFLLLGAGLELTGQMPRQDTSLKVFAETVQVTPAPEVIVMDPLYLEIKGDPIKKQIYLEFGQISLQTAREALEVAKRESNFNPEAKNATSSAKGIFQIIDGTFKGYHCKGSVTDYIDNITCAAKIYKSNGDWRQWQAQPVKI